MRAPIPYSEDLERLADNEEKTFDALQKEFQKIVSTTHRVEGTAARGVHAKSHAFAPSARSVVRASNLRLRKNVWESGALNAGPFAKIKS